MTVYMAVCMTVCVYVCVCVQTWRWRINCNCRNKNSRSRSHTTCELRGGECHRRHQWVVTRTPGETRGHLRCVVGSAHMTIRMQGVTTAHDRQGCHHSVSGYRQMQSPKHRLRWLVCSKRDTETEGGREDGRHKRIMGEKGEGAELRRV